MSSSRLPGKTLVNIGGRPLLEYILDSLRHTDLELRTAVVTSTDASDDPIAEYAEAGGLLLVRGSLTDVAGRFAQALDVLGCDAVFRVNGDSPLIPVPLFRVAHCAMKEDAWDLVTNIFPRRYPPGMSLELIRAASYRALYQTLEDPEDKEHVTRYFYRHPQQFRIHNLTLPQDFSSLSFAIDTPEDAIVFERMVQAMTRPHWSYPLEELIALRGNTASVSHAT